MARLTHPQFIRNRRRRLLLDATYQDKLLATNPIAYWPLNEGSGTTITDVSGNGYNGTYTGVTWPGTVSPPGTVTPFFDGANDVGDVYSAGFASAFDMDEFTIMLWFKVNSAAVWTDATRRDMTMLFRDASNFANMRKVTIGNSLEFVRTGNATEKVVQVTMSPIEFTSIAISCSVSADELKAYKDGVQVGSTVTGNIASAGSGLATTGAAIGSTFSTVANVWHGYLAHAAVWNKPMDNTLLSLMTV